MIPTLCRSLAVAVCVASVPLTVHAGQAEETTRVKLQEHEADAVDQLQRAQSNAAIETLEQSDIVLSSAAESTVDPEFASSVDELVEMQVYEVVEPADEGDFEAVDIAVEGYDAAAAREVPSDRETVLSEATLPELSDSFRITNHILDDERIAIFYIDDMPVLTFVDQSATSAKDVTAEADDDLLLRAEAVARQIDEFYRAEGDPDTILVNWEAESEAYVVMLDSEPLVTIDDATRYFNTTERHYTDALHATNRLRVLMGGADDLTEIEGAPEPDPVAVSDWGVASTFSGQASWYGPGFNGRQTASGETFNQNAMTAAHRTLPFGTRVRVTNVSNSRYVIVRINDRGPFSHGRVIDLSAGAAREIGLDIAGVGAVRVEVLTD
ncbi:MAG: septal ring lytic transglycosylase RlpA family protein [Cyanobacteria bacterium P01_C01_bin.70]